MDLNLNVLRLASQLASHASTRQTIISENIANADTPGYHARDVDDFAATLEDRMAPFTAKTTRPQHVAFGSPHGFGVHDSTVLGAESPNGNSVSLEDQMTRAADIRQSHELAMGVYEKSLNILRASLGK
ncbi:FlgB family protein [Amaricoccus sp.]|uniref:FlgB family protein n=1 Tax=Amaricoccus sp. TaxID=1872485 RepID=UPI0026114E54|nr:FlgB family protein [uncultured Amaricoccus sp.]